jgi:NAD(P)-dependent dehydrogenase (short-subunit alcohol dehydrogenase family)
MQPVDQPIALIVGGSSGIGRATAQAVARASHSNGDCGQPIGQTGAGEERTGLVRSGGLRFKRTCLSRMMCSA